MYEMFSAHFRNPMYWAVQVFYLFWAIRWFIIPTLRTRKGDDSARIRLISYTAWVRSPQYRKRFGYWLLPWLLIIFSPGFGTIIFLLSVYIVAIYVWRYVSLDLGPDYGDYLRNNQSVEADSEESSRSPPSDFTSEFKRTSGDTYLK